MQTGLSQIFDPYNLYAKAFPGIVFFILFISILPKGSLSTVGESGSLLAALVLLIIVLGFVFGQAIHSISGFIESSVYVTLRDYYYIYKIIRSPGFSSKSGSNEDNEKEISIIRWIRLIVPPAFVIAIVIITRNWLVLLSFIIGVVTSIIGPVERFRERIRAVLTPHRDLFEERLSRKDDLATSFIAEVTEYYDFTSENSYDDLYIAAMSRLEFAGAGRARLFQAIFSFSRSLWIILIFYSIVYIVIGWNIDPPEILPNAIKNALLSISTYQPTLSNAIENRTGMIIVGSIMSVASLLFFRSEAKYKKLFVDYVLVDYLTLYSDQERPDFE